MPVILGLLVLAGLWAGACTVAGFGHPGTLGTFAADLGAPDRRFRGGPDEVRTAYRAAAGRTAGMRLADEGAETLLVDLRPTVRVMDGSFGLVMLFRFTASGSGSTVVACEAKRKVPFAFGVNDAAALRHAERALRTRAKGIGLHELVPGIDI